MVNSNKQKAILDKIFLELDDIDRDAFIDKIGGLVFYQTIDKLSKELSSVDYRDIIVDFSDNGIHFILSLNGNKLLMIDGIFNYCDNIGIVFFSLFIDKKLKSSGSLHIDDINDFLKDE